MKIGIVSPRLPLQYQEVEYIQSSGSQYINTNYYWHSDNTKVEAVLTVTSNTGNQSLWGNEEYKSSSTSARYFSGIPHGQNYNFAVYIGGNTTTAGTFNMVQNTKAKLEVITTSNKKVTLKKDDVAIVTDKTYSETVQTYTATFESNSKGLIYIFANHNSNKTTSYSPTQTIAGMKLYSFKMWDEGSLVRNFVPCYNKAIPTSIGLYDLVTNTFFPNNGSGNFTKGEDIDNRDIVLKGKIGNLKLPTSYQEVDCVTATPGAYLDTGYIPNYAKGFEISFKFRPHTISNRYCLLSNYNEGTSQLSLELAADNSARLWLNSGSLNVYAGAINTTGVNTVTFKYEPNTYYISCNGVSNTGTYTKPSTNCSTSMYMFLDRLKRTTTFTKNLSIYSCTIKEEGILIHDYIPCYNTTNNIVGMYDKIEKEFLSNEGTGTFSYNNIIRTPSWYPQLPEYFILPKLYQRVTYIKGEGAQYINTALVPESTYKIELDFTLTNTSINQTLWCARGATTSTSTTTAFYLTSGVKCDYGVSAAMTSIGTLSANTRHTLTMDANKWYLDGVLKCTHTAASFITGGAIKLFASYYNGINSNIGNFSQIKMHTFKVWDTQGKLIMNMIPCYKKSDLTIGLYDIIGKSFYANLGSGSFTKGDDIV